MTRTTTAVRHALKFGPIQAACIRCSGLRRTIKPSIPAFPDYMRYCSAEGSVPDLETVLGRIIVLQSMHSQSEVVHRDFVLTFPFVACGKLQLGLDECPP